MIWVMIIPIAILNGGFREYVLVKLGGLARPLSGIILSVCIFIVAYLLVPKIKNCVKRDYFWFGVMWFILTNLFDLSAYIKNGEGFAGLLQLLIMQGHMKNEDANVMALQFFAPIYLLMTVCDREPQREAEALQILEKHIRQFNRMYKE